MHTIEDIDNCENITTIGRRTKLVKLGSNNCKLVNGTETVNSSLKIR